LEEEYVMRVIDELHDLEQKAIVISRLPNRDMRHKGGYMLESECRHLDSRYRVLGGLDSQAEISLRAVLQMIFDYILYDALDDEDWTVAMPSHYDGDIEAVVQGLKQGNAS
jgi:hypothetical protein